MHFEIVIATVVRNFDLTYECDPIYKCNRKDVAKTEIPNSAVGQMSLTDRCRCRPDVAVGQMSPNHNIVGGPTA